MCQTLYPYLPTVSMWILVCLVQPGYPILLTGLLGPAVLCHWKTHVVLATEEALEMPCNVL